MSDRVRRPVVLLALLLASAGGLRAQAEPAPTPSGPHDHHREPPREAEAPPPPETDAPALPAGATLDEVLDAAASPPPAEYPDPVMDAAHYAFARLDQLEVRLADDAAPDLLGWEAQGWLGGDLHKLWWKSEGEAAAEGPERGESEIDLLYSRLVTPFWSLQAGVQLAHEWSGGESDDRWSGVIALQGLAPYRFELDHSLYLSRDGDVTLEIEGEYDLRVTQRWVLQPRAELSFSAQGIPERSLGSGLTEAVLDLRVRYEIRRELAPYAGLRYRSLVGGTEEIAEAAGEDTRGLDLLAGLRLAF